MTKNQYITIGRYILIEYLKNPGTFTERISRNRVLLAEKSSPRSKNVFGVLKAKIEQIVQRRADWLQICNGRLSGTMQWRPDELGLELEPLWKEYFGLGEMASIYEGLELHWTEVVLYDLIGRAFATWIETLL